eukprot:33449-Chlamydomonas_euryale.AAC.2
MHASPRCDAGVTSVWPVCDPHVTGPAYVLRLDVCQQSPGHRDRPVRPYNVLTQHQQQGMRTAVACVAWRGVERCGAA